MSKTQNRVAGELREIHADIAILRRTMQRDKANMWITRKLFLNEQRLWKLLEHFDKPKHDDRPRFQKSGSSK